MTTPRKHRCGGTLYPSQVDVRSEEDGLTFQYRVPGFVCDECHEELTDRDAASKINKSLTLTPVIWFAEELGTFRTEVIKLRNVPFSTPQAAA